jgi:hypothetical protein
MEDSPLSATLSHSLPLKGQSPLRKIAGGPTQSQLFSTETEECTIMTETTVKHKVLKAIEKLPHDATFEDVLEHLYFLYKIDKGLQQVAAGETISHEEAMKRIKTWHA